VSLREPPVHLVNAEVNFRHKPHVWSRGVARWFRLSLSVADPFVNSSHVPVHRRARGHSSGSAASTLLEACARIRARGEQRSFGDSEAGRLDAGTSHPRRCTPYPRTSRLERPSTQLWRACFSYVERDNASFTLKGAILEGKVKKSEVRRTLVGARMQHHIRPVFSHAGRRPHLLVHKARPLPIPRQVFSD